MYLLSELVNAERGSPDVVRQVANHADPRSLHACMRAGWLAHHEAGPAAWQVTQEGRAAVEAGLISNATDKVNIRVPDPLREAVDAKNARIGTTTTAVLLDALRRYVAEKDETSALRLEARIAPDIRAQREAAKVEQ